MNAWVLWDCLESILNCLKPSPSDSGALLLCDLNWAGFYFSICSAGCGGVADSEIRFHLTLSSANIKKRGK